MDEARAVLTRLERIEQLDRSGALPAQLLGELRVLVSEAEAWVRAEPAPGGAVDAVERLRAALDTPQRASSVA